MADEIPETAWRKADWTYQLRPRPDYAVNGYRLHIDLKQIQRLPQRGINTVEVEVVEKDAQLIHPVTLVDVELVGRISAAPQCSAGRRGVLCLSWPIAVAEAMSGVGSIKRREKGQIRAEVIHRHHLIAAQPRADDTVPPRQSRLVNRQVKRKANPASHGRIFNHRIAVAQDRTAAAPSILRSIASRAKAADARAVPPAA